MILIHWAFADETRTVVKSMKSELLNMDLKSVGAKSLPNPATLRKSSHLLGPKVLQSGLLKLGQSDGHGEVPAIEYSHIPSFSDDVISGTKDTQKSNFGSSDSLDSLFGDKDASSALQVPPPFSAVIHLCKHCMHHTDDGSGACFESERTELGKRLSHLDSILGKWGDT
ncbi:uncharacterized protein LOC133734805 [Rosa rugosa]|uniref:uncharacterized protein LOC133734805 n=1 Tax=Rosa rugosa TaxID=74645 RepID=UPI002B404A9C|nr:uncharacterized protein LOC133734805 [Rosa rugosa]